MRYTIGSKVAQRTEKGSAEPYKIVEGIYVFGEYGLPFLCSDIDKIKEKGHRLYCINTLEDAENYIRFLSRLYRTEFRARAKKLGVSMDNFQFYLVKLDTPEFGNFNIIKSDVCKEKKGCERVNLNNVRIISIK